MKYFITNQKTCFKNEFIRNCTIQDCIDYFKHEKIIEVDTETEYCTWDIHIDPLKRRLPDPYTSKVLTLQLGNRFNQFVIDCGSVDFIPYVKPLLENHDILKIFTNAFFDLRFIFHWGINIKNICDIFLNEIILTRGLTKPKGYRSLGGMAERYLGVKLNKEVREEIQTRGLDTTVLMYASEDVRYMSRIKELQDVELKNKNLHKYAELENKYIISLARASYKGFKLNSEKWLKVEDANKKLLKKCINDLDEWVIQNAPQKDTLFPVCTIKWTSSKQVVPFMKSLGIDVEIPDKEKGGNKESVEIKLLLKQLDKSSILPLYIKFKEVSKELTTYGNKFLIKNLNPITKKIHSEFYPIKDTGRISSNKPNIQNIPGEYEGHTHPLRLAFEPFHDIFIVADYSQQEPRITADKCQDPYLMDFVLNGDGDSHSLIATMISSYLLGKEVKVSKTNNPFVEAYGKTIRAIGKTINLGLDYGKSAFSVKDDLKTSQEEAQKLIDLIKSKTPEKEKYFQKCRTFVEKHGYIKTEPVFNSVTYFNDFEEFKALDRIPFESRTRFQTSRYFKLKGEIGRFAQNNPIQGTASLMTKLAHIYIDDEIEKRNWTDKAYVCALIHDEIVMDCKDEIKEELAEIMKVSMIKAGNIFCKSIPMKIQPEISKEWNH